MEYIRNNNMNSKISLYYITLICLLICVAVKVNAKDYRRDYVYEGNIDNDIKIGMSLTFNDNILTGTYYYNKYLTDIQVDGMVRSDRTFVLHERDTNGNIVADFIGYFPDKDPENRFSGILDRDVMVGIWKKPGIIEKSLYLSLSHITGSLQGSGRYGYGPEHDEIIEKEAQRYWLAVISDNKMVVADYYSFPISGTMKDGKKIIIRNKKEFINMYEYLFTSKFKDCIRDSIPKYMFHKYVGMMLGCTWFSYDNNKKKLKITNPGWF